MVDKIKASLTGWPVAKRPVAGYILLLLSGIILFKDPKAIQDPLIEGLIILALGLLATDPLAKRARRKKPRQ